MGSLLSLLAVLGGLDPACAGETIAVRYGFTVRNTGGDLARGGMLWAFAPMQETASAVCGALSASAPYELETDALGNRALLFRLPDIPPYGRHAVSIEARIERALPGRASLRAEPADYLGSERPFAWRDEAFQAIAPRFDHAADRPREIYGWVRDHLQYGGYDPEVRDPVRALAAARGDCTEFTTVFASLCRRDGIPTRGLGGFVCEAGRVLVPSAYHNWAEFFSEGRWQVADPLKRAYGEPASWYVALHVMPEGKSAVSGQPLFGVQGANLKASMNEE